MDSNEKVYAYCLQGYYNKKYIYYINIRRNDNERRNKEYLAINRGYGCER